MDKLEPAEPGLFRLKEEYAKEQDDQLPEILKGKLIRFILTVEISNIYSKNNQVRKLHNVLIAPSFQAVAEINDRLSKIGNLKADGRPILGLDSKELLRISMETNPDNFFIPAHIWTPWFSMFGSKSGFNAIEEAFEELSPAKKAVETGLSSDPYMNWRINELQNVTLVSNSDAHSPWKLGREANTLDCKLSYYEIINAIKKGDERFIGTIEFYPEEGKYHYDGHRVCKFRCNPEKTKDLKGICPKCGKPLVVGVQSRVSELSDNPFDYRPKTHKKLSISFHFQRFFPNYEESRIHNPKQLIVCMKKCIEIRRRIQYTPYSSNRRNSCCWIQCYRRRDSRMRQGKVTVEPAMMVFMELSEFLKKEEQKE
jgi:PHP family Zn ribbon phosphoesterase